MGKRDDAVAYSLLLAEAVMDEDAYPAATRVRETLTEERLTEAILGLLVVANASGLSVAAMARAVNVAAARVRELPPFGRERAQ